MPYDRIHVKELHLPLINVCTNVYKCRTPLLDRRSKGAAMDEEELRQVYDALSAKELMEEFAQRGLPRPQVCRMDDG